MTGTITVDIALLVILSSQLATWVKVFIDAKKARAEAVRLSLTPSLITTVANPPCSSEMVREHIAKLQEHATEIENIKDSVVLLRTETLAASNRIETKLDKILMNGRY